MEDVQKIITQVIKENKDKFMIVIKDVKGKVISQTEKIDFREICRYPTEGYYKYKGKIWKLEEVEVQYQGQNITIQIYTNIKKIIEERTTLKKDRESGLILGENVEKILGNMAKRLKTTSSGITVILFKYDDDNLENYKKETISSMIKELGDIINKNLSDKDYGIRLDKNSFLAILDNCGQTKFGIEKAEAIQTIVEARGYATIKNSKPISSPIIYYGVATIGTTRIPNNDPMTIIKLAKENLERQETSRKEVREFLEIDNQEESVILS